MNSHSSWWFAYVGYLYSFIIKVTYCYHGHIYRCIWDVWCQLFVQFICWEWLYRQQIQHQGVETWIHLARAPLLFSSSSSRSNRVASGLAYESLTRRCVIIDLCTHTPSHTDGRPCRQMTAQTGSVWLGYTEQTLASYLMAGYGLHLFPTSAPPGTQSLHHST